MRTTVVFRRVLWPFLTLFTFHNKIKHLIFTWVRREWLCPGRPHQTGPGIRRAWPQCCQLFTRFFGKINQGTWPLVNTFRCPVKTSKIPIQTMWTKNSFLSSCELCRRNFGQLATVPGKMSLQWYVAVSVEPRVGRMVVRGVEFFQLLPCEIC